MTSRELAGRSTVKEVLFPGLLGQRLVGCECVFFHMSVCSHADEHAFHGVGRCPVFVLVGGPGLLWRSAPCAVPRGTASRNRLDEVCGPSCGYGAERLHVSRFCPQREESERGVVLRRSSCERLGRLSRREGLSVCRVKIGGVCAEKCRAAPANARTSESIPRGPPRRTHAPASLPPMATVRDACGLTGCSSLLGQAVG